ncbi:Transposable element tcb1 transposase [Caligus rogercresseyi]|uniref:Transposable element tcb1 transposase n=1 Tax=Caligus rogercresseyi TaxID=217165 RepID=A0A7T8KLW4_CALRO|nr:Transposable element tcb1 transposase [Caligus rogercresseyi]
MAGLKRSIKANLGRPCPSRQEAWIHLSSSLDGLCGLRDPVPIPAGFGARPQGQTCAVLVEKNVPNFWDFNT